MRFLVAAAVIAPALALANGRTPQTNGVFFRPSDAHTVYIRSTFGLLVSRDDGCSFRWVCEQAIGYGGQFNPKYRVATDGTIFATTFTGLRVSRDGGCTWATATADRPAGDPGRIADTWIDALDIGPTGHVWVATAESGRPNNVFRSTDNGRTFAPAGLPSPVIWWKSIKVAPANARRVYATGYQVAGPPLPDGGMQMPAAHLYWSQNGGESWTPSALAGVMYGPTPIVLVAGVAPANADALYMTSLGAMPPNGDRVYRSTDGGRTFAEVLATTAPVSDSIFHRGKVIVATISAGSFESTDGATFTAMANAPQLACIGTHDGQLVGCGANWQPDEKAVARSTDGIAWRKLFRFVELAGPLQCAAGTTTHDKCEPMWPALRDQLGSTGPPACVAPEPEVISPKKPAGGGCCDAGRQGGAGALAAGLLAVLRRRRR